MIESMDFEGCDQGPCYDAELRSLLGQVLSHANIEPEVRVNIESNIDAVFLPAERGTDTFWIKCIMCFSMMVTIMYLKYAYNAFLVWERDFASNRVPRSHEASVSNKEPPHVKTWEANRSSILIAAAAHPDITDDGNLQQLRNTTAPRPTLNHMKIRASRTMSMTYQEVPELTSGSLSNVEADALDMDHIYISFFDFLWGYTFIRPCTAFLIVKGIFTFLVRDFIDKNAWKFERPDPAKVVGDLLLQGSMSINYQALSADGTIAAFYIPHFPYVDHDGDVVIADLFAIDIDLRTKTMVHAKLDDEVITATQAMILCSWYTVGPQHVKLHSLANWAVNTDASLKSVNPFFRRNSVVTIMYNYFGFSGFSSGMIPLFVCLGLLGTKWGKYEGGKANQDCFRAGIINGISHHSQILELMPHSRFISFVVKARKIFLAEFYKHKSLFPGTHGEALFVGTVLHSIDHLQFEMNLDPIWLDRQDEKYGMVASLTVMVSAGFTSDLSGLYFHKRFKGSSHPFYESVYRKCAKIDKLYADNMDTCIIK